MVTEREGSTQQRRLPMAAHPICLLMCACRGSGSLWRT